MLALSKSCFDRPQLNAISTLSVRESTHDKREQADAYENDSKDANGPSEGDVCRPSNAEG